MSKATNTFFNSGVMIMILVNVVVGTPWKTPFKDPLQTRFCSQVLAMDRYPEHLVEASVGDAPQLWSAAGLAAAFSADADFFERKLKRRW